MPMRAYENEELDLTEDQRVGAEHMLRQTLAGKMGGRMPTAAELIESIRKHGPDDAYLETALMLTMEEYEQVAEVYNEARKARRRGNWSR